MNLTPNHLSKLWLSWLRSHRRPLIGLVLLAAGLETSGARADCFYCGCNGNAYSTETACVSNCNVTLACAGSTICGSVSDSLCLDSGSPQTVPEGPLPNCGGGSGPSSAPGTGARTTAADPVDVFLGATLETSEDFALWTSTESISFTRFYTSDDEAWDDDIYADLYGVPGPFGKSPTDPDAVAWWHNYFSYVTDLVSDIEGNEVSFWSVRVPGGALLFFDRCSSAPCWALPSTHNNSIREKLLFLGESASPRFMLLQEDGRRLFYGAKHVVEEDYLSGGETTTRYFLTATATAAGSTIATMSYAMPTGLESCASGSDGSDPGVPYLSRITSGDGTFFSFGYVMIPGTGDCVIDSINSQDGLTQMTYSYDMSPETTTDTLTSAERQPTIAGAHLYNAYSTLAGETENSFVVTDSSGTEVVHHHYGDLSYPAHVTQSHALYENMTFSEPDNAAENSTLQGSSPALCATKTRYTNTATDLNVCLGDGVTEGSASLEVKYVGMGTEPARSGAHFYYSSVNSPDGWYDRGTDPEVDWACTAPASGPDYPIGDRSSRGYWTTYSYQGPSASTAPDGTVISPQSTELTTMSFGATTIDGTNALFSINRTFVYGPDGQQLLASEAVTSTLGSGMARNYFNYEFYAGTPKGSRLAATIHEGWTCTGGSCASPVHKFIGTFYLTNHACSSDSTHDSQRRVLEVHGPCFVNSATATDCNSGDTIPVTQYYYNATDGTTGSGQVHQVVRYSSATSASCTGGLTTTFDAYDVLGHPTSTIDSNGQTTVIVWAGPKIKALSRSGFIWTFTYDRDQLTSIGYPEGNYEVFCYRTGGSSGCDRAYGDWTDRIQWRAKAADIAGSTWSERVVYAYWRDGTVKSESYEDPTYGVRKINHFGANVLRQQTYAKQGEESDASQDRSIRQFNSAGDVTAIGFGYNDPPDFCGSVDSPSLACSILTADKVGRLVTLIQTPAPSSPSTYDITNLTYDARSNVAAIQPGCTDTYGCAAAQTVYAHDDFDNLVSITAPWLDNGAGASGTTFFEYDAQGHTIKRQTPMMRQVGEYVATSFDMLGRVTGQTVVGSSPSTLFALAYDGLAAGSPPAHCSTSTNANGRLRRRTDSFGDTWYEYDALGRVTHEVGIRAGSAVSDCSGASPHDVISTSYTWSSNGNLTSISYPFGRTVSYVYGTGAKRDRVESVTTTLFDGSSWNAAPFASGVLWEPYGGLRAYIVDHQSACAPTYVNYRHGSSDSHTGLLRSLTVGTSETGSEIYRRDYAWKADQVTQTDTYLLGGTTPRTETYEYDALLRLTSANRPSGNAASVGGVFTSRSFGYDRRGNRASYAGEDATYSLTYGATTHPDQLTGKAPSASGTLAGISYHYDLDGRVDSMASPNDSSGTPGWKLSFSSGADGSSGAQDSVFKALDINGTAYGYFYDAFNRRWSKAYPVAGVEDNFFYQENNTLLVDVGNDSVVSPTAHPTDEYIWLAGVPIGMVRGRLGTNDQRQVDTNGSCPRNGADQACGVFAIITDHTGAPVLLLDGDRHVVGEASMDPFGSVNTVSLTADTLHPYLSNTSQILADFYQAAPSPAVLTRLRVVLGMVDTEGSAGSPVDGVMLTDGETGANLLDEAIGGLHVGRTSSAWVSATNNHVKAVFSSNASGSAAGVVLVGYEYQRYQSGATPTWLPLRYPGQYADSESGLFQNWNRFYEPATGRYLQADPLQSGGANYALGAAEHGILVSPYNYAASNPLWLTDRDGRKMSCTYDETYEQGHDIPDGKDAATAFTFDTLSVPDKCSPVTTGGTKSWKFDVTTVNAKLDTSYRAPFKPSSLGNTCHHPEDTLGDHEKRHRDDFKNAMSDAALNSEKTLQTEGFSTPGACENARRAFSKAFDKYVDKTKKDSEGKWDCN